MVCIIKNILKIKSLSKQRMAKRIGILLWFIFFLFYILPAQEKAPGKTVYYKAFPIGIVWPEYRLYSTLETGMMEIIITGIRSGGQKEDTNMGGAALMPITCRWKAFLFLNAIEKRLVIFKMIVTGILWFGGTYT